MVCGKCHGKYHGIKFLETLKTFYLLFLWYLYIYVMIRMNCQRNYLHCVKPLKSPIYSFLMNWK